MRSSQAGYRSRIADFYRLMKKHRRISGVRLGEDYWTLAEMVGHLIDSASNNHQRFVRLQLEDRLSFPAYEAESWRKVSKADSMDYRSLVELWKRYNDFLIDLIDDLAPRSKDHIWVSPDGEKTLGFLIEDYFRHIDWHFELFALRAREIKNRI